MITLTVNGKKQQLEGPTKLTAFLDTLEINRRHVAVARNGSVVRREEWPEVVLEDGDVLEIVRMVGGGSRSA
jgi:thiamine biosynthesis protein ThiS